MEVDANLLRLFPSPGPEGRSELLAQLLGTQLAEAVYVINYLHQSLTLPGDVCEFGVAQGATSALLANEIRHTDKLLWLFDSFAGLPKPHEKDTLIHDMFGLGTMEKYQGTMAYGVNEVLARLQAISYPLPRVKIIPGFIEDTISSGNLPNRVCFAYVDFDFYEPILIALNYLNEHLSTGGCAVVDDYGYFSSGAQAAVDEFVASHSSRFDFILPDKSAGHFAILVKTA
jgi:O-methyltransferase